MRPHATQSPGRLGSALARTRWVRTDGVGVASFTQDAMCHDVESTARTNIRLELASRPGDVLLARELLRGIAVAAQIEQQTTDDICTAVTEACNNVVQHAYDGTPGPVELDLCLQDDALGVTVRDRGAGMQPAIRTTESDTLGIGLMVMKALSQSVQLKDRPAGGMEVHMRFAAPGLTALDPCGEIPAVETQFDASGGSISVAVGPPSLAAAVLPRLLGAMAARAHLSTDRMSDLQILGEVIAVRCRPAIDGRYLCAQIAASPRTVALGLGPLAIGGALRLLAEASIEGIGGTIERLTDEREIHCEDHAERLVLRVHDRR